MIKSKFNVIILLIFLSAQAAEDTERFAKYYIYALASFTAAAAIVIPIYLKSNAPTLDGSKIFEKSSKEALSNFTFSGNLYPILRIEDSIIPEILSEYEKYPAKNSALLNSFFTFKKQALNYKYNLLKNNPSLIKKIRIIHSGLPEDVNKLIGNDIDYFLKIKEINYKTSRKIQNCERKLLSEINK